MTAVQEEALVEAGLTKNESRVYLALLRLNTASALEVTKESRVHRVNVYDALERLREKGLISSIMKSNKRVYEAANPDQVLHLLKKKEELINQVLPSLKLEYDMKKPKQDVMYFIGPEGVMNAYYMFLDQNADIYAIGGSGLNRKHLGHRHEMWNRERLKRKVGGKVLYYEFTRKKGTSWKKDPYFDTRFIPDKFKTPGMIDIAGDLVMHLLPTEDNIVAIVIEDAHMAETFRQIFRFMWEFAKE